jgi:uncharacterized protein (TIGR02118 family)
LIKTLAFVHRRPGTTPEEFADYWVRVHAPLVAPRMPGLRKYELNVAFQPPDQAEPPAWDGVAILGFDHLAARERAYASTGFRDPERRASSERLLDLARNESIWTEEHVVVDEGRPSGGNLMKQFALVRRRPGMSHEEFADFWVNTHGPLVKTRLPGLRKYVLNVAFQPPDRPAPEWDGVVELGFDDYPSLKRAMSTPEWLSPERQRSSEAFLDLGKTQALHTVEHVVSL